MLSGKLKTVDGYKEFSRMVMGTWPFGSNITEEQSFELMDLYAEAGGRTIDTARSYNGETKNGDSKSERAVGRWLKKTGMRDKITLVTKGAYPELHDMHRSRMTPDCIRYDINTSLAVLDQDYVDLWLYHRDDEAIPVGELVDSANELIEDGLTKAIGVSNWKVERIIAANEYAKKHGKVPFTVSQILWNMATLDSEVVWDDTLVYMDEKSHTLYERMTDMSVMAFTSQAVGFFSKYPAGGIEALSERGKWYATKANIEKSVRVDKICERLGCSPAALCVAYITNNSVDGYAVVGCTKPNQLADSLTAADMKLPQEIIDEIDGK